MPRWSGYLGVRRQDPERASPRSADGPEVALVKREQVTDAVASGQDHDRRIGQADLERGVLRDHPLGGRDVLRLEAARP